MKQFFSLICAAALLFPVMTLAQGAQLPFGGLGSGEAKTVEMAADSLSIDRATNTATFTGNVVAGIGELRLVADLVTVIYAPASGEDAGKVTALTARGNVVFTSGEDAAQADNADYDIENGEVIMTGNVILTQGPNALSSERLRIDLNAGTALMEGRVQTIFQTGGN